MTKHPLSSSFILSSSLFLLTLMGCNDDKSQSIANITLPNIENNAPVASGVTIARPTQPGTTISGQYNYSDDWDEEGKAFLLGLSMIYRLLKMLALPYQVIVKEKT
eukprot:TRINITY_DN314_c0_g1_i8.p1 TRINITY_DN314_c0_g1~~TRINITY_DN314_c0_g1_i8.p1  ORF type:complete len:106 (+),score=4.70 TRINITY_DN314_c0_g1_i8:48-365(+)